MKIQLINSLIAETLEEQYFFKSWDYEWPSSNNQIAEDVLFPRVFHTSAPDGNVDFKKRSAEINVRLIFQDLLGQNNDGTENDKTESEHYDDLLNYGYQFTRSLRAKLVENGMTIEEEATFDSSKNAYNDKLIIAWFEFRIWAKLSC